MKNTTKDQQDIITVSKKDILQFKEEGGKLFFSAKAETQLLKLLELKEMIDSAIEEVKEQVAIAGQEVSLDFRGVIGQRVRAIYRVFGEKYTYDKGMTEEARPWLNEFTVRKVISTEVDAYTKEHDTLPPGIIEKERAPKISLSITQPKLESETTA